MVMVASKREKGSKKEQSSDESEDSSESETSATESSSDDSDSSESQSSTTSSSDSGNEKATKQKQAATKQAETNKAKKRNLGRNNKGNKATNANNANKKAKKRRRKPRPLTICLTNCRYEIVRNVAKRYSLMEVGEDESWNIYWTDFSVSLERAMDMRRYQVKKNNKKLLLVNHFPGMNEICRKDLLSRNLNRMKRLFQCDYDIFPKTWSLPADLGDLQSYAHNRKNKTYICKPEMGCQGRGIFLIRNIKDLNPFGKIICQLYVSRPFLIDNFKFDLRIYVLMTTCDPLRIYVYNEGLARFATAKYKPPTNSNTENSYMHLTNYAVNKYSRDFVVDDEGGSKRKLSAVYRWLEQRSYDTDELIANIDDVIIKTIISAHPILKHNYRTCFPHHDLCSACFEILGFDILLDHRLKPFVLEVNHSPSFHTDARLDRDIKEGLLNDTFAMLNMKQLDRYKVESDDRRRVQDRLMQKHNEKKEKKEPEMIDGLSPSDHQFQWELDHSGGYRLVYPSPTSEKYDKFFEQNLSSLYHETASSQARATCTRNQMEEYSKMKQQEERKRLALGLSQAAERPKEKVRPESPADPDKPKLKKKMSKMSLKKNHIGGFVPGPIIADEELDRMKSLMQRGMLIRSLGIELQVFKLLCQIGNLKPEEEKIFRRMHGFTSSIKPKDNTGRNGDRMELLEQMQKGEPLNTLQATEVLGRTEATNRGDFAYANLSSTTVDSTQSFRQTSNAPNQSLNSTNNPVSIKNPYSVPYNSPAQFGVYQTRPKSSSYSPQAGVPPIQNISNFMDKVNPVVGSMNEDDQPIIAATATGFFQPMTERRFHPNHAEHTTNEGSPIHPGNNSPIYPPKIAGQSRLSSFANETQTFINSQNLQRTLNNLRHPPRTAGVSSIGNANGMSMLDSVHNSGRVAWPPPPLATQNAQFPNDPTKLRTPVLATKSFRPQGSEINLNNWTSRNAHKVPTTVTNGNIFIRRPKASLNREDNDPVQCTQMFLNSNAVPSHSSASGKAESRQGVTNLNFLRGVGNVALLRAGRLNVRSGTAKQSTPSALLPLPASKINQTSPNLACKGIPIGQDGNAFK